MSNSMEKTLSELRALTVAANTVLDNVPYKNRSGMAVAMADAQKRLAAIELEYKEFLKQRAFTLFIYGPTEQQAKFAAIAAEEGEVVVVGAEELYERLASQVEPVLGITRQFGGTALGHLIRAVEDAAKESGTGRLIKVPRLLDIAVTKTHQDVVNTCREIVLQETGGDLNKDYIEHLAFKRAFEARLSQTVIPVVVLNSTGGQPIQTEIFNGRGIEVDVAEVDQQFVLNTFKRVRDEVAKTKKQ